MAKYIPVIGDYVLATKYSDGDPCDHFCVGFISCVTHHGRYLVVDNEGQNQRENGFRKVGKITREEGSVLVALMPLIGDREGQSVWRHLAEIKAKLKLRDRQALPY